MKTIFQNTLLFFIILSLVSCKTIEPRSNTTPNQTNVTNNPPIIISFDAEPDFVPEGNAFTLIWRTNNATDVHISGIGMVSPSGYHTVTSSAPDRGDIILTASNNAGFPPVTQHLPMQMVMFSTQAPPGVPLNTPVYILADQKKLRSYQRIYHFKTVNRVSGFKPSHSAISRVNSRSGSVDRVKPLHRPLYTSAPVIAYNYPSNLTAPQLLSPANQSRFNHYPRNLTLRWKAVANAKSYNIEIDCMNCCARGKWCSDIGKTFKRVPSLTNTHYKFQFVGAQSGRWRVQAVDKSGKPGKQSQWSNFLFTR
jgi:hypothetical protein